MVFLLMSISNEDKQELVKYWLEKSEESIESAKSEKKEGRLSFAINRLYYAMFYAMTAILTAKDETYSKHSGVRAALHRDFIKTGKVNNEIGKLYDELFNARHQADYTPLIEFEDGVVKKQIKQVEKAVKKLELIAHKLLK